MKLYFMVLSLVPMLFMSTFVYAERKTDFSQDKANSENKKVTLAIHAGAVNVQANELVYSGSHKLSELIWDTKQAYMVGADISVLLNPSKNSKFNANISTTLGEQNSTMDDYDWFITGADWTHWSHHNNTTLQKGQIVDLNFSQTVYENSANALSLDLLLGYKADRWRWQAIGGSYVYSSASNSLRDLRGLFPNVPVISYEQSIDSPYVGAAFDWKMGDISLAVKVIGSSIVSAKSIDQHHLRSVVFTDRFKKGKMVGGDIDFSYNMTKNTVFGLSYSFQNYSQNRGDTVSYDQVTGQRSYGADYAGMSLSYQRLGVSGSYSF